MTPRLGTKDASVTTVLGKFSALGRTVANLVLVQDSGKPPEFRVQCEIILDESDADDVSTRLKARTPASLAHIQEVVTKQIDPLATPTFREIIKLAFKDNTAGLKQS